MVAIKRYLINKDILLFVLAFIAVGGGIYFRKLPYLMDDGAFFLRYAVNMAHGYFWKWNIGGPPVWGASAPLWPLPIAILIVIGIKPVLSLYIVSVLTSIAAFILLYYTIRKSFGLTAALAFIVLLVLDSSIMLFSINGLESPLTFLLIALAFYGLNEEKGDLFIGIVAGILMVHKIDMIPIGLILLLCHGIICKRIPKKAVLVAAAIALAWYVFAWIYFGYPLPNSFLTKAFHQGALKHITSKDWIIRLVFLQGTHEYYSILFVIGCIFLFFQKRTLLLFLLSVLLIPVAGYTIKPPFEPYNWYGMPSILALIIIASIGCFNLRAPFINKKIKPVYIVLPLIVLLTIKSEYLGTQFLKSSTYCYEGDRTNAGIWVSKNTPSDATVLTAWGNPAYFSNRDYIYDDSFLNRKYEKGDLIKKYKPDILILQGNPESTPWSSRFGMGNTDGYSVVRVFEDTFAHDIDKNYYFSVLARNDYISKLNINFRDLDKLSRDTQYNIEKINESVAVPTKDVFVDKSSSYFVIKGWAVDSSTNEPAKSVTAEIDGERLYPILGYGVSRPDVAQYYHNDKYEYTGFDWGIPVKDLSSGEHILRLRIINSDGTGYYYSKPYKIYVDTLKDYFDNIKQLPNQTQCSIDSINGNTEWKQPDLPVEIKYSEKVLTLSGWAVDSSTKEAAKGVVAEIDGKLYSLQYGINRPDLVKGFKNKNYLNAGFNGNINIDNLKPGVYQLRLRIINSNGNGYYCSRPYKINLKG